MNKLSVILVILIIMYLSTIPVMAAIPNYLQGSWIIDRAESEKYLKTSPKWDSSSEKFLPSIMKRMSLYQYTFSNDRVSVTVRNKKQSFPVKLIKSDKKYYLFNALIGNKNIKMRVNIRNKGIINIQIEGSDDMDYYLWKRGNTKNAKKTSDNILANELSKKLLNNSDKN